ncbi:MAG: insulinase family protein, partial [Proteobacteria bacterium]|nr:insulinase family protein [Pseudomonadota bacterium]
NELDQTYARLGITGLNAYTNSDATVYVSEIPKNRIAQWAKVEAARYSDAVFRLFWPELEAVYEEKNRGLDNAPRRAYEAFLRALYPQHAYGRPVLGEVEHLKSPAYGDMEAFYNRYYTPQNMAILLAGDVDASVLPLLEQEFGSFKRPAGDVPEPGQLVPQRGRAETIVKVPANPGVMLGWHLVSATDKDRDALQLMDLLLLDGESGMIARDLLLPQKVADAGSGPSFQRDAGYFQLYADALDGQSNAELEQLLLAIVGKHAAGDFTDTDLSTAILTAEIQQQRQLETNGGRMAMMEEAFINGEEWSEMASRIDRFRKITKADITRVAKQYLTPNFVVINKQKGADELPKIEKPGITAVKVDPSRHSAFARQVLDLPVTPIEPVSLVAGKDYERASLVTGDLVSVKNTRNTLFSIAYEYNFGRRNDRLACLSLEIMKVAGAGKQTADQVARQLHELCLSIDTSCGKTKSIITLSGIDRNMDQGMALLREWLADAAVDEPTVKARVAAVLTERANQVASPQGIAGAQVSYARWGADSDALVVATNKQLQATSAAQIKKLIAGYLKLKHRTSYFGPRTITADKAQLATITLGDGKVPMAVVPPVKFRAPNTVLVTDQTTAQTHVWMMWPRKPATAPERAVGTLFSEYVSPILYQEVREARGLAYTVYGYFSPGDRKVDDASVGIYIGTQGDKTHDAIAAIAETIGKPIDDTRIATAKEAIAQTHRTDRIQPRAIASYVYGWDDQGFAADPREAQTKATLAVDKAALEKWLKAALAAPRIVSITGDRKKLDEAKLKALGPVTTVPVAKLFGY